ncbi:hypothetical protein IV203_030079 [Nitzschia inconspicua]|uniref:Uncharacterized protein n=1 Tax=Nitzschia inconspicua TaxID=303405 RepID=A0A9K3Q1C5_9STRA|nr:hypothetical protein IV203_030079 [Nitzschia inconspicua]
MDRGRCLKVSSHCQNEIIYLDVEVASIEDLQAAISTQSDSLVPATRFQLWQYSAVGNINTNDGEELLHLASTSRTRKAKSRRSTGQVHALRRPSGRKD